ncbi:hypothetical protein SH449x_004222 [Pirellulaceae bacterium SH449]
MKTKQLKPNTLPLHHSYRTLGLERGECRIDVIRSAATEHLRSDREQPHHSSADRDSFDQKRAQVALATYRLLDPRNRTDLYERVQLSCPLNEEEIHQPVADFHSSLNRSVAVDVPPRSKETIVNLMNTDLVNRAIEIAKSAESDFELSQSFVATESEPSLSERRQVVRLLREIELSEAPQQSTSPLAWLKSYLKL